ncbi:MAG: DUF4433 domain-containing protein [Rikenellaceae bacterium]|jgi:hypothetical protein|nr:DUF4433 domain-containing protein [Rikenellaceae bacterium]
MPDDYLHKPIFRMVHFDNLEHLLRNGMCTQNHELADPHYINIGDNDLIRQRQDYPAKIVPPGGNLGDYVPFYFWGHSPMLLNIKTGWRGIKQRLQVDIVFIVCSIRKVIEHCPEKWCFTDGHAKTNITIFFNSVDDLGKIDWPVVYSQDWHNNEVDWDKMRKKQAEFLVKDYVPVACIKSVVVYNQQRKEQVEEMLQRLSLDIPVKVDTERKLYYP